jgi:3-hydroxybutyryl-CoA dehydrogenase
MAPPHTIIATPSIALSVADIAACTYRPERCVALGLDPRNFLRLPEEKIMKIRTTDRTDLQAIETVSAFWQSLGFFVSVHPE